MKTNLFILLAAFIMLFTSCTEKQATEFTYNDYLSLQSDDDWVEITDTLHPYIGCSSHPGAPDKPHSILLPWYKISIFNNDNDFNQLSDDMENRDCWISEHQNIDFDTYTLLAYSHKTGKHTSFTQFFQNDKKKEYKLIVHIHIESRELLLYTLRNWLLVPKLREDYEIIVDTLNYLPE